MSFGTPTKQNIENGVGIIVDKFWNVKRLQNWIIALKFIVEWDIFKDQMVANEE